MKLVSNELGKQNIFSNDRIINKFRKYLNTESYWLQLAIENFDSKQQNKENF